MHHLVCLLIGLNRIKKVKYNKNNYYVTIRIKMENKNLKDSKEEATMQIQKVSSFEKFFALVGVVGQTVIAMRPEVSQTSTPLGMMTDVGLGFLGLILAKQISPENSVKKAAFLTLGGVALLGAGIGAGFDTDSVKNALLAIPTVMMVTGLSIGLNHYISKNNNKTLK